AMVVASLTVIVVTGWRLPPPPAAAVGPRSSLTATVRGYRTIWQRYEVRLLVGLRCMPTCYWGAATLLVPLLLYRASHLPSTAALYSGISLALAATCQLLTGRIADRVGRRAPALFLTSCIVLSALLLGLFSGSLAGLYVFGIFGACSAWSLSVLMPGLIKELSEPGEEGRTLALTHFVWSGSMLLGSLGAGALVVVNSGLPFLLAAALNVFAVIFALALLRSRRARVQP
ncbi:MAG TPA: MFS transporter, partial [Chloroflexota bacterium]